MGEGPAERDELAATFRHPGVADAYRHRPPYPAEVFGILERIITDRPRRVLDIGAGEGALARPLAGRAETAPTVFRQPVADYVEHFHSTASLARELMIAGEAAAFGQAVEDLVRPYAVDGVLDLPVAAGLTWGRIAITAGR